MGSKSEEFPNSGWFPRYPMPVDVTWFRLESRAMSIPVLSLADRRSGTTQQTRYIFLYDLERALYADRGHSTGSIHRLLTRENLQRTTLPLKKCSVQEGIVTEAEFREVIQTFQEVLPLESCGRVKSATLLPLFQWCLLFVFPLDGQIGL